MKGKVFFSNGKVAEAGSTGILNINGKKMKITLNKENIMKLVGKGIVDGCCFFIWSFAKYFLLFNAYSGLFFLYFP